MRNKQKTTRANRPKGKFAAEVKAKVKKLVPATLLGEMRGYKTLVFNEMQQSLLVKNQARQALMLIEHTANTVVSSFTREIETLGKMEKPPKENLLLSYIKVLLNSEKEVESLAIMPVPPEELITEELKTNSVTIDEVLSFIKEQRILPAPLIQTIQQTTHSDTHSNFMLLNISVNYRLGVKFKDGTKKVIPVKETLFQAGVPDLEWLLGKTDRKQEVLSLNNKRDIYSTIIFKPAFAGMEESFYQNRINYINAMAALKEQETSAKKPVAKKKPAAKKKAKTPAIVKILNPTKDATRKKVQSK